MSKEYQLRRDRDDRLAELTREVTSMQKDHAAEMQQLRQTYIEHYESKYNRRVEASISNFRSEIRNLQTQLTYHVEQSQVHLRVNTMLLQLVEYQEVRTTTNCPFYPEQPAKLSKAEKLIATRLDNEKKREKL